MKTINNNLLTAMAISSLILLYSSVFYVGESQKAIKFRLGEIIDDNFKPGLNFQIPLLNNVKLFDARVLTLDTRSERFLTSEKKNVIVDSFAKWRIANVGLFYTTMDGDAVQANLRLDQIIKDAMRSEFGLRTIKSLVSEDRSDLRRVLMNKLSPVAAEFGIQLLDLRIRRIDLPKQVSSSVYKRMEAERARVAREFRSQGAEQAELISAEAEKRRDILISDAYRKAELIRGKGDAEAAHIYASSYEKDEEFYAFYRSLQAYQASFENTQDTIVLKPNSDFFKYFSNEE